MKKILAILMLALAVNFAFAQDGAAILQRFVDLTGTEKFKAERSGKSAFLNVELSAGPMVMPIKVTSKYPNFARIEMSMQGQNLIIIQRDTMGWVKVAGNVQKVSAEQIKQMAPMTDIADAVVDDIKKYTDLKYEGKQGKGKSECEVVSYVNAKDKATGKMFFNVATGLLDRIEMTTELEGKKTNIKTAFKDYTKYADGALYLPSKIEASTPQGNMVLTIKAYEIDYPTAAWMFAEPK